MTDWYDGVGCISTRTIVLTLTACRGAAWHSHYLPFACSRNLPHGDLGRARSSNVARLELLKEAWWEEVSRPRPGRMDTQSRSVHAPRLGVQARS